MYHTSLKSLVASEVSPSVQPAVWVWEEVPYPPHISSNITWFGDSLLVIGD